MEKSRPGDVIDIGGERKGSVKDDEVGFSEGTVNIF